MAFEKNVFVNCPFDEQYRRLLRAMLFTPLYLDFKPQLSTTYSSSDIRVDEIKKRIRKSKFSIDDWSRRDSGVPPRFNMPFELGLDIGCISFGNSQSKKKRMLILDSDRYTYQSFVSDIAGQYSQTRQ
jgi:hypothetical protein